MLLNRENKEIPENLIIQNSQALGIINNAKADAILAFYGLEQAQDPGAGDAGDGDGGAGAVVAAGAVQLTLPEKRARIRTFLCTGV